MICNDRSHFTGSPSRTMATCRKNTRHADSSLTRSRSLTIDGSKVFIANEALSFHHFALKKKSK